MNKMRENRQSNQIKNFIMCRSIQRTSRMYANWGRLPTLHYKVDMKTDLHVCNYTMCKKMSINTELVVAEKTVNK